MRISLKKLKLILDASLKEFVGCQISIIFHLMFELLVRRHTKKGRWAIFLIKSLAEYYILESWDSYQFPVCQKLSWGNSFPWYCLKSSLDRSLCPALTTLNTSLFLYLQPYFLFYFFAFPHYWLVGLVVRRVLPKQNLSCSNQGVLYWTLEITSLGVNYKIWFYSIIVDDFEYLFCLSIQIYGIDAASGAAVTALDISVGDHVLDLCAAPGNSWFKYGTSNFYYGCWFWHLVTHTLLRILVPGTLLRYGKRYLPYYGSVKSITT